MIQKLKLTKKFLKIIGVGYVQKLPGTLEATLDVLDTLRRSSWVDRQTRLVLYQFNLYNFNSNLFAVVNVAWEFLAESGGIAAVNIDVSGVSLIEIDNFGLNQWHAQNFFLGGGGELILPTFFQVEHF